MSLLALRALQGRRMFQCVLDARVEFVQPLEGKIEGRRSQGETAGATFLDRVRAQARAGYASAAKCDACGTIQYPEPGGRCPGCGEPMRGDPGASLQAKVRRAVEGIGCR